MSAQLKPICAYATATEDPDITNGRIVEAELQRLVDAESWNEPGQDREFMGVALRIMGKRWDDPMYWTDAMVDAQYGKAWNDEAFLKLLRDGDECAMGRFMRERWLAEFAEDVFEAAESELYV